jgi:hypothetical protein
VVKALPWSKHCRGQSTAVVKALPWSKHCRGQSTAVVKALLAQKHGRRVLCKGLYLQVVNVF